MNSAQGFRRVSRHRHIVAPIALAATVLTIGWVNAEDQVDQPSTAFFMPVDVPLDPALAIANRFTVLAEQPVA
mgnify:CR=1 FL=1